MRLLVLGGSWFAGYALVQSAANAGHDVVVFNRGLTPTTYEALVQHITGDRESDGDLAQLATLGPWDAVIDVAGAIPAVVDRSARHLSAAADRYVFYSTISAYRDWPYVAPITENSPLFDGDPDADPADRSWDPDAYGPLKVGCELAIARYFPPDLRLTVRPHVVLGPGEYVGRLPWWLSRVAAGGRVLAPGPDRSIQPIDVRDLAAFVLRLVEGQRSGVFNAAAPPGREMFSDFLDACRAATGSFAEFEWIDETWLVERGVQQWTEIPLWRALPTAWSMSTAVAEAAGLSCRPLAQTVRETWGWLRSGGQLIAHERFAEHGLSREKETALLADWAARRPSGR